MARKNDTIVQKIDRFCLHIQHCVLRGIGNHCVDFYSLDEAVQETFKKKLNDNRIYADNLMHSRFCCCSQDLCNTMSPQELFELFNVTSSASPEQPCLRFNLVLLIYVLWPYWISQSSPLPLRTFQNRRLPFWSRTFSPNCRSRSNRSHNSPDF